MKYLDLKAGILAAIRTLLDFYEFKIYADSTVCWSCPLCKVFGKHFPEQTTGCSGKVPCIWWVMKGKGCWGEYASHVRPVESRRHARISELLEWQATVQKWTSSDIGRLFFRTKYGSTLRKFEAERKAADGDQKNA